MFNRFSRLILVLVLFSFSSNAQKDIDSLTNLLKRQTDDVAKKHLMLELGDRYQSQNPDSALRWYTSIIPSEINDIDSLDQWFVQANDGSKYYVTVALARSGIILFQKNQLDRGQIYLATAYSFAKEINQPQLAVYSSDNLAVALARSKRLEEASAYFDKSLEVYKELNDIRGILYCLGNLGIINANLGNLYKAADYYEQLLNIQEGGNSPAETLDDLLNIAAIYTQLEEYQKAKGFWDKAYIQSNQIGGVEKERVILTNLGLIATKLGQDDEALTYYQKLFEASLKNPQDKNAEILAMNNMAILSGKIGNVEQSILYWEKTFELGKSGGYAQVMLDALINLSNLNNQLGNLEKASVYYENYIAISKQVADYSTIAQSYIGIGEIQERLGSYDKAREFYSQAQNVYLEANDFNGKASTNTLIAKTFHQQQQYYNAMDFYNANLDFVESLDAKNLASTYQGKAEILRLQMQYDQALEFYQKALKLRTELHDNIQASVCLNAMGLIYEVTGNFPSAVNSYETALGLARDTGNKEAIAAVSNNLGVVYRQLGDLAKARDSYQRALEFYLELNNEEGASYCYNNLGIIFEHLGNYDKANEYYEKSLAIKQNSQDMKGLATSLMNMGNVYKFLGNHTKAEETYNRALSISNEINDEQGKALALGSIAALKLETNDYQTAIEYSKKSLEIASAIDLKSTIKEAHRQLGWAYNATLVPEWAEDAYLKVIDMNHEDITRNFSILSESEKELFFKTVAEDFDRFHSFAIRRMETNPNITQNVYDNLLRNKGLLLKSSTAMRTAIFSSNNQELIQNFEKWIQIKQEIASLYTLPVEQRAANPEDLEKQANDLERLLVRSSSEFSDFEKSLRIDWTSVRNGLEDGEAAIEFTHFANSRDSVVYCALVLTKNYEIPVMVKLFEEKSLEKVLGSFGGNNLNYINGVYGTNTLDNNALYNLIWKPIENHLIGINTVYFSPSGLLHKVSFAAIGKGVNNYLIDDFKLHLVSTTANVNSAKSFRLEDNSVVSIFGGISYTTHPDARETWTYLNGTLDETRMITNIMQQQIRNINSITDSSASEKKFKEVSPQSQVLHIATHGFFFPDPLQVKQKIEEATEYGDVEFRGGSPTFGMDNFVKNQNPLMRSGLVFSGVNDYWSGAKSVGDDDGVLTALEVINIDLRENQLVVMSACETGLGDIAGSEGVYGLQRAFKMAGTNFLIMSLWQVPDKETSEFMQTFYSELLTSRNLQESFSKTQTQMRLKYDPFFWAAFVLLE